MSVLLNEEYNFPYWESPSSSTIINYVTTVKNFFIENFGFYANGDITTYNTRTVCYFSENENDFPCFCFIHACLDTRTASSSQYKSFFIAPVLYDAQTETFIPGIDEYNSDYVSGGGAVYKNPKAILINCCHASRIAAAKYITLIDGRKMIFFKNKLKSTGLDDLSLIAMNGCLYYTTIKSEEESIQKWIILARSPASSYIPEINGTFCHNTSQQLSGDRNAIGTPIEKDLHDFPYQYINPRYFSSAGGFIPSYEMRKDYLLKLPYFYLGDTYYIENIFFFSKVLNFDNSGPVGTIILIKDKYYIILQSSNNCDNIRTGYDWNLEKYQINTISLITPIEIEEEDYSYSNNIENNFNSNSSNDNENHEHNISETTPSLSGS